MADHLCWICEFPIKQEDLLESFVYGEFEGDELALVHRRCHEEFEVALRTVSERIAHDQATKVRDHDAAFLKKLGIEPLED